MKKVIVLLFMVSMTLASISQKSGILKKDHYGAFTGDDWEDFLAGKRAKDFEKKSNVTLAVYLSSFITPFVTTKLKESTIASAVANSTVKDFPAGADVHTVTTDGTWITRKAYPGERGFFHTQTGLYWLSFECGNLTAFGPGPTTTPPPAKKDDPQTALAGNTQINISSGQSVMEFYSTYRLGQDDYAKIQNSTMTLFKEMKEVGCCGGSSNQSYIGASTLQYTATSNVQHTADNGGGGYYPQEIVVRNKANALDYINTGLNVANTWFNGTNTYRGIRFEDNRRTNYGGGYGGGGGYASGPVRGATRSRSNTDGNGSIRPSRPGERIDFN